ncbi:MAG TPA: hypothetical protein VGO41_04060 [Steroidobacteraceae bacterium]|jgi:hypothetical protein|nr:hypothetical protein [Steroidobacteraceae bacterium]
MIRKSLWSATFAALVLLAGCAGQKEPASKALAAVEASVAEIKADATQFSKKQFDTVEGKLTELKANFEQKKYKEVIAGTTALQTQVAELKSDVATKSAEFNLAKAKATETWTGIAAELPNQVTAVEKRIAQLAKSRRIKQGAASEESQQLDHVKNLWSDANNLLTSNQTVDAAAKAEEAKAKLAELAAKLKVKL